ATYQVGHFPPPVNSGAALGGETVLCGPVVPGGPPVFFTRKLLRAGTGEVELTCWQANVQKQSRPLAAWVAPHLEPLMVRVSAGGGPALLLKAAAFENEPARVRCPGKKARTTVLASRRVPAPVSPVVVGRPKPRALPLVVVQGANETVEAFRPVAHGRTRRL